MQNIDLIFFTIGIGGLFITALGLSILGATHKKPTTKSTDDKIRDAILNRRSSRNIREAIGDYQKKQQERENVS